MSDFSKVQEKFWVIFPRESAISNARNVPENVDFETERRRDVFEHFSFSFFLLHFELDLAELVNLFERGNKECVVDGDDSNDVFELWVVVCRRAA